MNLMRWNAEQDGPLSEAAMRRKLEAMGYSVSRYTYAPGFSPHTHGVDKIDGVLAGRFRMGMQEGAVILEAGDLLEVRAGYCIARKWWATRLLSASMPCVDNKLSRLKCSEGLLCKAPGAQKPECTVVHEDFEHRATPQSSSTVILMA